MKIFSKIPRVISSTRSSLVAILFTFTTASGVENATVTIDTDTTIAVTKNNRLLGGNIALWYEPAQLSLLENSPYYKQWSPGIIRIPGGSWSDEYYWNGNGVRDGQKFDLTKRKGHQWQIDYSDWKPGFSVLKDGSLAKFHGHTDVRRLHEFAKVNAAESMVTVNAGMGTPEMAAEWVRWANKKMGYHVKYWEIGNELEGDWELGNTRPDGSKMDAKKYAALYLKFAKAMKAVDPTIKIGGATNSNDSIVFVEELIKTAGAHVDFISFHTYPVDSKIKEPRDLLNETARLSKATDKIRAWLKEYQPERADEIEIGITEWHVKVHEDDSTCNLVSGLWSTRFIGEMFKNRVDFANQWDTFSTTSHGGHGLFDSKTVTSPRGSYWALWLWSNHMGDKLVKSTITGHKDLISFATIDGKTPAILLINQSSTESITSNLTGLEYTQARTIEFSHSSYLWNPYAQKPFWSIAPTEKTLDLKSNKSIKLPPLSATVIRFGEQAKNIPLPAAQATTDILLPKSHPSDLALYTNFILKNGSLDLPYTGDTVEVIITTEGPIKASVSKILTNCPVTPITLTPTGVGKATITLSCGGSKVVRTLHLTEVKSRKQILWTFEDEKEVKLAGAQLPSRLNGKARRNQGSYEVSFNNLLPAKGSDLALEINPLDLEFPKGNIGGLITKLKLSPELLKAPKGSALQLVLQSEGNHWIVLKEIPFSELSNEWQDIEVQLKDSKQIEVMPLIYSVVFKVKSPKPLNGNLYVDDLGFILRK